jgi:hypothetical protein
MTKIPPLRAGAQLHPSRRATVCVTDCLRRCARYGVRCSVGVLMGWDAGLASCCQWRLLLLLLLLLLHGGCWLLPCLAAAGCCCWLLLLLLAAAAGCCCMLLLLLLLLNV